MGAMSGEMDGKLHVLIADDDPGIVSSLAEALETRGATVVRAQNGGDLIEALGYDGPFDLVVTDVSMPWMTGLQAIQSARSAGVRTSVIVMTALDDAAIPARVRALGECAAFLHKPFGIEELDAAIDKVTSAPQQGAPPPG